MFDVFIEAVRRLRIQTDGKEEGSAMTGSMAYPDRPGEPDCIFYLRTGMCGYGDSCRFNHPTHIDPVKIRTLFVNYTSRVKSLWRGFMFSEGVWDC